jgi:NitT/TauT family transport system ATP-binding protein
MLSVKNISFAFDNQSVLERINIECGAAETVGIVGQSGSGKTTLLNLIAGYIPWDGGAITVDGVPPVAAAREQKIGYIFQTPTLMPWLTVRQNVELPLRIRSAQRQNSNTRFPSEVQKVEDAMTSAHIAHAANKFPHELSGGMQTRASIARAIVYQPILLLADEPLSALDDVVKESLYQDFQEITAERRTATVLVTHNLTDAILLCDRVYVLGNKDEGTPSTVVHCEQINLARPRTPEVLSDDDFLIARRRLREALK